MPMPFIDRAAAGNGASISARLHIVNATTVTNDASGVVLDGGTIVRIPPYDAERLAFILTVGSPLWARGQGLSGPLGKLIAAREIGPSRTDVTRIDEPRFEHARVAWVGRNVRCRILPGCGRVPAIPGPPPVGAPQVKAPARQRNRYGL